MSTPRSKSRPGGAGDALARLIASARDRASSRTAAPGTDADRHSARVFGKSDRAGLRPSNGAGRAQPAATAVATLRRGHPHRRPPRATASVSTTRRLRTALWSGRSGSRAPSCATASGSPSWPTAAMRGRTVAVGRLGHGVHRRLDGARPLARDRRRLAWLHARRPAAGSSRPAGLPCQLLRGRCVRALGRQASAERSRMGSRGARRRTRTTPSASSGSGRAAPILPIPAIAPVAGALGEYNGKFMVNQMVLRGSSLATPAGPCPRQLPQLLPSRRALAVQRACGSPISPPERFDVHPCRWRKRMNVAFEAAPALADQATPPGRLPIDVLAGLCAGSEAPAAEIFLRRARIGAVRGDHPAPRILPDPHRDRHSRGQCGGDRQAHSAPMRRWSSSAPAPPQRRGSCCAPRRRFRPMCRSTFRASSCRHERCGCEQDLPISAVLPVAADFTKPFELPAALGAKPRVGFFPGLDHRQFRAARGPRASAARGRAARTGRPVHHRRRSREGSRGPDAAYNDADRASPPRSTSTCWTRINRELGGDFDAAKFCHRAFYNQRQAAGRDASCQPSRPEGARRRQDIEFRRGETIHTENSYKYTLEVFLSHASAAGWTSAATWTDPRNFFAVLALRSRGVTAPRPVSAV